MSYYPTISLISSITNAVQAVVTFTDTHDFTVGEIISFRVGKKFGMYQINQKRGKVLSKTADTVTVDIDSTYWDAFSLANLDAAGTTPPNCVPSSSGFIPNATIPQTNIDDAFDKRPA